MFPEVLNVYQLLCAYVTAWLVEAVLGKVKCHRKQRAFGSIIESIDVLFKNNINITLDAVSIVNFKTMVLGPSQGLRPALPSLVQAQVEVSSPAELQPQPPTQAVGAAYLREPAGVRDQAGSSTRPGRLVCAAT